MTVKRNEGGVTYEGHIQPPDLELPFAARLVLWILRPVVKRVLEWAERSILALLVQIGVPKGKRLAVHDLFEQLRRLLDEQL